MAFENLFIRTEKKIGEIQLDGVVSESHSSPVRITRNPVELGVDLTDHATLEPKKLTMVAAVTDTPLGFAAVTQLIDNVTGLFGSATTENLTRSQAAYNALVALKNEREPISVQTGLVLYENMLITDVQVTQNKDSSRMVLMNITFEEVIFGESQIIPFVSENLDESVQDQAASAESNGRQLPIDPVEAVKKSTLKAVKDWIFP